MLKTDAGQAEPRDARACRRQRTLAQIGEASTNSGPLLAVLRAQPDEPDEVGEAIRQCPMLSARVLSIANSAVYGRSSTIESIDRAVLHLGASRARAIAMAFGLRALNEASGLPRAMARTLWISSLRKACAGQLACELIDPHRAAHAYARALIQDVGLPPLVALDPDFYAHHLVPGSRGDWTAQEIDRFGIDHAEVGSHLLVQWEATEALVESVQTHHQPPGGRRSDTLREPGVRIATYLASLLPHLGEDLTGAQREWLTTLHGQFLGSVHASPDTFFQSARHRADMLVDGSEIEPMELHSELAQAVASDTITMISQLCRLEGALGRQREGIDELRFQAFTDPLTKVLNRRGFTQLAERRLEDAAHRQLAACCIVIDLDELKPVNDTYGHVAGDRVLRGMAKVLRRRLDRNDLIGRLGGDEFAVLLTGVDEARAREITQRVIGRQNTRIRVADGVEVPLRFSVGAIHVEHLDASINIEKLITLADEAMYYRKHTEKGGSHFLCYVRAAPPSRPGDGSAPLALE
ncbi:MAG: diguanylate cyclase [Phycisphaeraceae bacterium]